MNTLNKDQVIEILQRTNSFYNAVGDEFSSTRQYYWKGWDEVFPTVFEALKEKSNINVLDIGCGNGRFYKYIKENTNNYNLQNITNTYLGIDTNDTLLKIATDTNKDQNSEFKKLDIFLELEKIQDKFDLIVGFGITHHIPGTEFRKQWFKQICNLLNKNGVLVLSYWNFLDKKSLEQAHDLEKNDYWLGWNTTTERRYCHYYDEKELNEANNILKEHNINIVQTIDKKEDLNKYIIYRYN